LTFSGRAWLWFWVRRRDVAVVGIGQTAFSKGLPWSESEVAARAIGAALADAGVDRRRVDGLCLYDIESNSVAEVARLLGLPAVRFFATHSHGGGSYCALVRSGAAALAEGHASVVVAFRARNRGRRSSFGPTIAQGGRPWEKIAPRIAGHYQYQVPFGIQSPVQEMALIARRHMVDYGTTEGHFGEVAVAIRSHAVRNPNAVMRAPMTLADHRASRWVSEPLRLLDCCIETDGGCALVMTTADRARDCPQRPAWVLATAQGLGPAHHRPSDWFRHDRRRWVTAAARALWDAAGVRPDAVAAAMVYDHFTPMVLQALEDWDFCGEGESGPFVEDGGIRWPDGRLPVNTHGGQLSEAFIHGFNNLLEAVRQIRGTSTSQVDGARLVFVASAASDPGGALLLAH
jgi:acetyl-CoA acetyltransferase